MDSWSVIDLKDGDSVLFAADAADEDRLVFVASDSSLLTFDAGNVRPQGRTAGGMAGIRLAEGCTAITFNVVPAGKIAWTYEEGDNGMFSASGAVVLTVAGDKDALPGTENGAAKVTPLEMYPTKGRGTGGVRSQRFLKGQNTLIFAHVGMYPLHASTEEARRWSCPSPTCAATHPVSIWPRLSPSADEAVRGRCLQRASSHTPVGRRGCRPRFGRRAVPAGAQYQMARRVG